MEKAEITSRAMTREEEKLWNAQKAKLSKTENEASYSQMVSTFENDLAACPDSIAFIKQQIASTNTFIRDMEARPVLNSNGLFDREKKMDYNQFLLPSYRYYLEYLENKLHDEIRAFRFHRGETSFPFEDSALIPEYYERKLSQYLEKQKEVCKGTYIEESQKKRFRDKEIEWANSYIDGFNEYPKGIQSAWGANHTIVSGYFDWLQNDHKTTTEQPEKAQDEPEKKPIAVHYVLAYIFEMDAKGLALPRGRKCEIEAIGNAKMGKGKGNTFYKKYNEVICLDRNTRKCLEGIGGANWRETVLKLCKDNRDLIEEYLTSKKLN
jgi:hypothetical protein